MTALEQRCVEVWLYQFVAVFIYNLLDPDLPPGVRLSCDCLGTALCRSLALSVCCGIYLQSP